MHYIFAEVRLFWRNQLTLLMKSTGSPFFPCANTFDAKG